MVAAKEADIYAPELADRLETKVGGGGGDALEGAEG